MEYSKYIILSQLARWNEVPYSFLWKNDLRAFVIQRHIYAFRHSRYTKRYLKETKFNHMHFLGKKAVSDLSCNFNFPSS